MGIRAMKATVKLQLPHDFVSVNSYVNSVAVFTDGEYAAPKFDRPVLHSEFHFGTIHRGMFSAGLCPVGDQPLVGCGDGEAYQIGFVDVCDRPY